MTIEVTGCHDCMVKRDSYGRCGVIFENVLNNIIAETFHPSCPLQTKSITIKKKPEDSGKGFTTWTPDMNTPFA